MFESHSYFETPTDNTVVWRYMTLEKLRKTLDGALWFNRCDCFDDKDEGRLPSYWASPDVPEYTAILKRVWEGRRECFINCWAAHSQESLAMWNRYAKDGVAIRSSVGRLKKALSSLSIGVFIGKVLYVDHDNWSPSPLCNNWLQMIPYKGLRFRDEEEVRLVLSSRLSAGAKEFSIGMHDANGYAIPIDLHELIESVLVHPNSSEEHLASVRSLMNQSNLREKDVVKSTISDRFVL